MIHGTRRRLVASLLAFAWIGGIVLPASGALHSADVADVACGDEPLGVPHPITQIEPVRAPVTDGHCAICHLQRAVRGAALMATSAPVSIEPPAFEPLSGIDAPSVDRFHALPPRAPPSDLANALS